MAVVRNLERQILRGHAKGQRHLGRLAVLDDVVETFADAEKQIVSALRIHRDVFDRRTQMDAQGDVCLLEKFLRVCGEVFHDRFR